MRKAYIVDITTSVDFHETVKIGGKVIELCEGVICEKILKYLFFKK